MAAFSDAFDEMILNEGGYTLHEVAGDRGGQTYAGIARRYHPQWRGWQFIDSGDMHNPELPVAVSEFYKSHFWDRMMGDDIQSQRVADALFDFAVNAGCRTAVRLTQKVLGTVPDGLMGPTTLGELNQFAEEGFLYRYAMAKVSRYAEIVNHDRSQSKFLLGWINRTLKGIS